MNRAQVEELTTDEGRRHPLSSVYTGRLFFDNTAIAIFAALKQRQGASKIVGLTQ
ncbi:hypothetical protein GME_09611 [Halomonas sp. TD01]|nr:hypothetical protein GME_09611 [Halomonas sp. TD01]